MTQQAAHKIAESTFTFIGCSELQESLGQQADDEKELAELVEEVPLDSIHFHTHSYFLRHRFIERAYPNDFAQWVVMQIGDRVLGERLAVVDPFDYPDFEDLREEIISIIDDHLSRMSVIPRVVFGEPFHFKRSRILEVPIGLEVRTLAEFRQAVADIDVSAIYYPHVRSAFSVWGAKKVTFRPGSERVSACTNWPIAFGPSTRIWEASNVCGRVLITACDEFLAKP